MTHQRNLASQIQSAKILPCAMDKVTPKATIAQMHFNVSVRMQLIQQLLIVMLHAKVVLLRHSKSLLARSASKQGQISSVTTNQISDPAFN